MEGCPHYGAIERAARATQVETAFDVLEDRLLERSPGEPGRVSMSSRSKVANKDSATALSQQTPVHHIEEWSLSRLLSVQPVSVGDVGVRRCSGVLSSKVPIPRHRPGDLDGGAPNRETKVRGPAVRS